MEKEKAWSELPDVTQLSDLGHTDFVTTLESPIVLNKNIIYAPAFLYAWDKLEEAIKSPIVVSDTNSTDFRLLVASTSHNRSLSDSEYAATVTVSNGEIVARAFFNKTLPFVTKLALLDTPIVFNKTNKVAAFGMYSFNQDAVQFTKVLYYRNDNHFVLQLTPKDTLHEIILVKGLPACSTLGEAVKKASLLIEKGQSEAADAAQNWKYELTDRDIFSIPIIQFNIATNYSHIQGQRFLTEDSTAYLVTRAYQRTGFILGNDIQ